MTKKFLLAFILVIISASYAFSFSGGSGTSSAPYQIANVSDMKEISGYVGDYYFVLSNDIQLGAEFLWEPIMNFSGHFDGNGNTIHVRMIPLTYGEDDAYPNGRAIFGSINTSGTIYAVRDLHVEGKIQGFNAGGIAAVLNSGVIENCTVSGDLEGIGEDSESLYNDDGLDTKLLGANAGGIIAVMKGGTIQNCVFTGNVSTEGEGPNWTFASSGGIVGVMWDGNIYSSTVTQVSEITAEDSDEEEGRAGAGGIAGYVNTPLSSVIENCNADCTVTSSHYAGGIAGILQGAQAQSNNVKSSSLISSTLTAGNTRPAD